MTVARALSAADLARVLDWAAAEGWNPGLDDAAFFHAADPGGFLGLDDGDGRLVSAISVVRHAPGVGFLGLYLTRPDARGRGFGRAVWAAGLARLADGAIGLDGVPAQQANYAAQGFVAIRRCARWTGPVEGATHAAVAPFAPADLLAALALDAAVGGYARPAWLGAWLRPAPTRRAMVLRRAGALAGFGVIRACGLGWKVGPLVAPDRAGAEALLRALARGTDRAALSLDIPATNAAASAMATDLGLAPAFETARMWRGPAPAEDPGRLFAVGTLELG